MSQKIAANSPKKRSDCHFRNAFFFCAYRLIKRDSRRGPAAPAMPRPLRKGAKGSASSHESPRLPLKPRVISYNSQKPQKSASLPLFWGFPLKTGNGDSFKIRFAFYCTTCFLKPQRSRLPVNLSARPFRVTVGCESDSHIRSAALRIPQSAAH